MIGVDDTRVSHKQPGSTFPGSWKMGFDGESRRALLGFVQQISFING